MAAASPTSLSSTPHGRIGFYEDRPDDITGFFEKTAHLAIPPEKWAAPAPLFSHRCVPFEAFRVSRSMIRRDREERVVESAHKVKELLARQSLKALRYFRESPKVQPIVTPPRDTPILISDLSAPDLPYKTLSATAQGDRPYHEDCAISGTLSPTLSYVATFDGHGQKLGKNAALDFLIGERALHKMLDTLLSPVKIKTKEVADDVTIWNALKCLFVLLQKEFDLSVDPECRGGVVGVISLFRALDDGRVEAWTANLGDCEALAIEFESCLSDPKDTRTPYVYPLTWPADLTDPQILRSLYKRGGAVYKTDPSPTSALRVPVLTETNQLVAGVNMGRSFGRDPVHISRRAKVTRGMIEKPAPGFPSTLVQFSDGFSWTISGEDISRLFVPLIRAGTPPGAIAEQAVKLAYEKGSPDNITVTVIQFSS